MQFSDTTNKTGILQFIEKTLAKEDAYITGTAARLAEWTERVNQWLHYTNHWIRKASRGSDVDYDDVNNTNFPIETYTLVDDQQDFGLDTDITGLIKVELHDATATDATEGWFDVPLILTEDKGEDIFSLDSGTPSGYWLGPGRSIVFNCPVDTAAVDYMRLTYDRHAHEFESTDTDATPGFDKQFHWLLVYGPIMDWAATMGKTYRDLYNFCQVKIGYHPDTRQASGLYKMLNEHYNMQNRDFINKLARKAPEGTSWK